MTFDIDADSIVHVSAKDKATNKDQSITIASGSGLSDTEIQSMIDDSEKYAEADKARKAAIEGANRADSVANDTEKAMKEFEEKLDKDESNSIKEKITALREIVAKAQSGDANVSADSLKEQTDALQTASLTLFDKMHRARADQSRSEEPSRSEPGTDGSKEA